MKLRIIIIIMLLAPMLLKAQLQISIAVTQPTCNAYTNGEATATVTGGTAPYKYSWSNGQGDGQTLSGVKAGNYTVNITDAKGVFGTKTFAIGEPTAIVPSYTFDGTTECLATGYIASATGGVGTTYTYSWRNLVTNATVTGNKLSNPVSGSYQLSVTDTKGCTVSKVLNIQSALKVTMRAVDVTCGGACDGAAEAKVAGGYPPYKYQWDYKNSTGEAVYPVPGGTYTVIVTDSHGCVTVGTTTVIEPPVLSPTVSLAYQCTNSGSAKANASGGRPPYTYKWSTGATTNEVTGLTQGVYYVSVFDAVGCNSSAQVNISDQSRLKFNVVKTDAACTGNNTGSASLQITNYSLPPYTYKWSNGTTGTTFVSNLAPGPYSVTVTDAAGCSDSSKIVIGSATSFTFQTTSTTSACGAATGSATVTTPTGGTAPYTYLWSNGATTPAISNVAPGTYSVVVTDATGCKSNATQVVVGSVNTLQATVKTEDIACAQTTGRILVTATGGKAPYTFTSSVGTNTTGIFTGLAVGNYTITVTDAGGCGTVQTSASIKTGTTNLVPTVTVSNARCAGSNGAVLIVVAGGKTPYTFKTGSTQNNNGYFTGLPRGTYTFSITDSLGCQTTATAKVDSLTDIVAATVNSKNAFCGNADGAFTVTATGGTAPYTYKSGTTSNTTGIFNNVKFGNYNVTVTDINGCINTQIVAAVSSDGPDLKIKTDISKAICTSKTGSILLTPSGGKAPYTFVSDSLKNTNGYFINLNAGTYNFTVTDSAGCPAKVSVKVDTTSPVLKATLTATDATCNNADGKVTLFADGGVAPYKFAATPPITDVNKVAAGTYKVVATDAYGCTSKSTDLIVNAKGAIKAGFINTSLGCLGSDSASVRFTNTTVNASPTYTSTWVFSEGKTSTATSPVVSFKNTPATARLIVKNDLGCSDTLTTSLNVDVISYTINKTQTTCQGLLTKLTVLGTNPNLTYKYKWTPSDSVTIVGDTTISPTIVVLKQGTAKIYLKVTNSLGCSKLDTINVQSINPNVDPANVVYKQDCATKKVTFSFANAAIASQYCWFFGDTPTSTTCDLNPSYTYPAAGNYTVRLVPIASAACLSPLTIPIKVREGAAVTVKADSAKNVCDASAIQVSATSNVTTYQWASTTAFSPILGTGKNLLVRPTNARNVYYVRVSDSTGNCTAIDSVILNNRQIQVTHAPTVDVCKKTSNTFTVQNSSRDSVTVVWSPSASIDGSNTILNPVIKAGATGIIVGIFRNAFGCVQTDTVAIAPHEVKPSVTAAASVIYADEKVQLNALPVGTGYKYQWSPPTGLSSSTIANPIATPATDTRYIVTVTDAFGCSDTASVPVKVLTPQCDEPYIFIPRAFSPNGDNLNEKMYVRGEYLAELEFAIYNRWGELVFRTTDKSVGWDGTYNGAMVCPDVYGYYVKGTCKKGEQFFKKGNITVMK